MWLFGFEDSGQEQPMAAPPVGEVGEPGEEEEDDDGMEENGHTPQWAGPPEAHVGHPQQEARRLDEMEGDYDIDQDPYHDILMEMNEQMVEAKMQLATTEQKLKLVEEALEREREKWRQETAILQEQIYMLQQRNNDLAWSNEELLRMKQSDAAYTELEDQKALMEAVRELSEQLYKKNALTRLFLKSEIKASRLQRSFDRWRRHLPASASPPTQAQVQDEAGQQDPPTHTIALDDQSPSPSPPPLDQAPPSPGTGEDLLLVDQSTLWDSFDQNLLGLRNELLHVLNQVEAGLKDDGKVTIPPLDSDPTLHLALNKAALYHESQEAATQKWASSPAPPPVAIGDHD